MNPQKDQYSNALKVVQQIINLTEGRGCIFRGESALYKHPCSSTLYRELKRVNATKGSIPGLLKQKQNKLIEQMRPHEEEGKNDMERLMSCQHNGALTNLLDFTESADVALFFACWRNDDQDGRLIVQSRDVFEELVVRDGSTLPDDRKIFMKPQKALRRAKAQEGLLVHNPSGFILFRDEDIVVIKREWKQEILSYLDNIQGKSYEKLFYDMHGVIEQQKREYEKQVPDATKSTTSLQGFAKSKEEQTDLIMEYYVRLLTSPPIGPYKKLLGDYADALIERFTKTIKLDLHDATTYYNRAFVHQSKPSYDYKQAISDYNRAIKLNPNLELAYVSRGNAYAEKSKPDYDQAIRDYDQAIKLNPRLGDCIRLSW